MTDRAKALSGNAAKSGHKPAVKFKMKEVIKMNMKYTVAFGDTRTESIITIITFVSRRFQLHEVLEDCGYNVTLWDQCNELCYVEFNSDNLPTGRYFMLISAYRTNEEESDEVIFF